MVHRGARLPPFPSKRLTDPNGAQRCTLEFVRNKFAARHFFLICGRSWSTFASLDANQSARPWLPSQYHRRLPSKRRWPNWSSPALQQLLRTTSWETFFDFAFSTSDPSGKDHQLFEAEVIKVLLAADGSQKKYIPKLRRLYAQSYIAASAHMQEQAQPKGIDEKTSMHPADRSQRTEELRTKITGFKLSGPCLPSTTLTDKFATILAKGLVRYVPWEKCTSQEQEVMEEPEIKGLRLTADGLLLQDVAPESTTDLAGEFLWDYALRRRACAADIAGLLPFEAMDSWHETLKGHFLLAPPPGYRKVSWSQLRNADEALWRKVAARCEAGTKARPGEAKTRFEVAWQELCLDQDIRVHLQFLPLTGAASVAAGSSNDVTKELQRLRNRLQNAEQQLQGQKRKAEYKNQNDDKGKDKNKHGRRGGKNGSGKGAAPRELAGFTNKTPDGRNICFAYNLNGCPHAQGGQTCNRGLHVCPRCFGTHPLSALSIIEGLVGTPLLPHGVLSHSGDPPAVQMQTLDEPEREAKRSRTRSSEDPPGSNVGTSTHAQYVGDCAGASAKNSALQPRSAETFSKSAPDEASGSGRC